MNSCILMAQVLKNPELRTTKEQSSVCSILVDFPSSREGESNHRIEVETWGDLAIHASQNYHLGDRIVIEGRISMNTFEINGVKQKKAKLVASKIYRG